VGASIECRFFTQPIVFVTPDSRYFSQRHEPKRKKGIPTVVKKKTPKIKTEETEREFWTKADSMDYIDWAVNEYQPVNYLSATAWRKRIGQPLNCSRHSRTHPGNSNRVH
jgi:hypothetical protein